MIETLDVVSGRRKAKTRVGPLVASHSPRVHPRRGSAYLPVDHDIIVGT